MRIPDRAIIPTIWKKVNKKVFDGRIIHSRPHVPLTPPKPTTTPSPAAGGPPASTSSSNVEQITPVKTPSMPPKISQIIPGLSVKEQEKPKKKKRKPRKASKEQNQEVGKKTKEMVKEPEDFQYGSDESVVEKTGAEAMKDFQFSEYSTDSESDAIEESKNGSENENDTFFTPLNLKAHPSLAKELQRPRSRTMSESRKRNRNSPNMEESKKLKCKELPTITVQPASLPAV